MRDHVVMRFKVGGTAVQSGTTHVAHQGPTYSVLTAALRKRVPSEPEFESMVGSGAEPGYVKAHWLIETCSVDAAQDHATIALDESMRTARMLWPDWSFLTEVHPWPQGLEWDD